MNLKDYKLTPHLDQFTKFCNGMDDATNLVALDLMARDLERRLNYTRDAIKSAIAEFQYFINLGPPLAIHEACMERIKCLQHVLSEIKLTQ